MNVDDGTVVSSYRTVFAHLHVVGAGRAPELNARALSALITANGEATQALLRLCLDGLALRQDDEGRLVSAELTLPCRKDKVASAAARAAEPTWDERPDRKGKIVRKKWYGKGNSYALTRFTPESDTLTMRLFERYLGALDGKDKMYIHKLPANFFQAAFIQFLRLPFSGMPGIVVGPALKQTAEQVMSFVSLLQGGKQEAEFPSTAERNPERRRNDWESAVEALTKRTEPMEFVRARDHDPRAYDADDPRGDRYINITPEWIAFAESPFPARLPLKITPDFCALFRRRTEGRAKIPERLYICLDMFRGARTDTELGYLVEAGEFLWWHDHADEFSLVTTGGKINLAGLHPLLMVPLEYDRHDRFEQIIGAGRGIELITLKEHRNNRKGRRGHSRKRRLKTEDRLWRVDFSTTGKVNVPEWNERMLGLHFADEPVITWTLVERDGTISEEGRLSGNPILERGLAEKEKLEVLQQKGRWAERKFQPTLKTLTHELVRAIVLLAVEKRTGLAIEDIAWVDKRSGDSIANRRFSMWNFSRLPGLIEWLCVDIATREALPPVPMVVRVSDYLTRYTCPQCGFCRQAKQNEATAHTWRTGNTLHCRQCGFSGVVSQEDSSRLVARKGLEYALKKKGREQE